MAMCVMAVVARRAVPMLLTRRERDHVAGPDLLDRATPALSAAAACRHDQRLAQRVGVPGGPGAGLERDAGAERHAPDRGLEERVDADRAGELLGWSFAGGL